MTESTPVLALWPAFFGLLLFGACETKLPDPPPIARSQELPLAPPGARGARAGSLDPPAIPTEPMFSDPLDESLEEAEPADAAPDPEPEAPDAGVAL
jgi:hypothetical protein